MNKKFELLKEAVGCYKANHANGDINEKALLEFIEELEQLRICAVSHQRELLIGFAEWYGENYHDDSDENVVDWYLRVKDN